MKAIAKERMFASDKLKESQDICFIPDGDHTAFIRRMTGAEGVPGPFLDVNGNLLGTHRGITHYTVGQRKGLGLALPEPYFVLEKDASRNAVILCPKRDLRVPSFLVNDLNGYPWIVRTGRSDVRYGRVTIRRRWKRS